MADGSQSDEEVTKPKRVLSEKQKEAFQKCVQARKEKSEARKEVKVVKRLARS